MELLCRCDDIPDEAIELRVLKGLLTAVTSSTINLHGQALLLAIRTSYNIYLMSRSEVCHPLLLTRIYPVLLWTFSSLLHRSQPHGPRKF